MTIFKKQKNKDKAYGITIITWALGIALLAAFYSTLPIFLGLAVGLTAAAAGVVTFIAKSGVEKQSNKSNISSQPVSSNDIGQKSKRAKKTKKAAPKREDIEEEPILSEEPLLETRVNGSNEIEKEAPKMPKKTEVTAVDSDTKKSSDKTKQEPTFKSGFYIHSFFSTPNPSKEFVRLRDDDKVIVVNPDPEKGFTTKVSRSSLRQQAHTLL